MSSKDGFNILGLCIKALNVGSVKYLLEYSAEANKLYQESFLVNPNQQISALQLVTTLLFPRSQGMKLEFTTMFMFVLDKLGSQSWQLIFVPVESYLRQMLSISQLPLETRMLSRI
jgi:hypothetical protein